MPQTHENLVQGVFPFRDEVPVNYISTSEQGSRDPDRYGRELSPEQKLLFRAVWALSPDNDEDNPRS